jgi:hypothetical protein
VTCSICLTLTGITITRTIRRNTESRVADITRRPGLRLLSWVVNSGSSLQRLTCVFRAAQRTSQHKTVVITVLLRLDHRAKVADVQLLPHLLLNIRRNGDFLGVTVSLLIVGITGN